MVSSEQIALEMYLMQMMHIKNIDNHEVASNFTESLTENLVFPKKIDDKNIDLNQTNKAKDQLKNTQQIKTLIKKNLENQMKREKISNHII